jgi:hypothetical protein
MSYKVNTKATNVVTGDQVFKDRKYRSVTGVACEPFYGATSDPAVTLTFGNGSTIPARSTDYVEVRRSSKATTPKQENGRHAAPTNLTVVENEEPDWLDNLYAGDVTDEDEDETDYDEDDEVHFYE